MNSLFNFI